MAIRNLAANVFFLGPVALRIQIDQHRRRLITVTKRRALAVGIHRALSRSLDFHLFRRLASMAALYRAPRGSVLALRLVEEDRDHNGHLRVRDDRPHALQRHERRRHVRRRRM